jgi:hypothetical protein
VAVGTLVNVCSTYRHWTARAGLDLAALPELESQIARVERDLAERDSELQVWAGLEQERNEITGAVIDGHLGLFEAAARFRDMNALSPDGGRMVRAKYPGSYDEQCCQQVISWTSARLALESPAICAKVTAELEAELRERQRRDGTIRLPQ